MESSGVLQTLGTSDVALAGLHLRPVVTAPECQSPGAGSEGSSGEDCDRTGVKFKWQHPEAAPKGIT